MHPGVQGKSISSCHSALLHAFPRKTLLRKQIQLLHCLLRPKLGTCRSPRGLVSSRYASSAVYRCHTVGCSTTLLLEREQRTVDHQRIALRALYLALSVSAALALWQFGSSKSSLPFCSASLAITARNAGAGTSGRSAWAGLAAGCLHSLSGPDHLAALTPLTIGRSSVKASLLGAWWGFGHCIGQLILGLLMLFLKDRFHNMVPVLAKYSSLTIGLTLITIGILGLVESFSEIPSQVEAPMQTPPLALEAVGTAVRPAEEPATAGGPASTSGSKEKGSSFNLWTLATGVVYGLQPDALFVIIPALALPTKLAAAAYMGMFVAGTVAAMGSYTAFIGATSRAIQAKQTWLKVERLSAIASLVALLMGITVAFGGSFTFPSIF